MRKYLFVTYGAPGWRGVQIRALRIAQYLPKKESLFWNLYDSRFIEEAGFAVATKDASLIHPNKVKFPPGVEVVIFADLPTNEFFQYSVFMAARERGLKIVVCEQIYRRGQLQEGVYKKCIENSDLFLVNALSYFKSEESGIVKVVPPQIEQDFSPRVKSAIKRKYGLTEDAFVIFGVAYHEAILTKIKRLVRKLAQKNLNFYVLVSGSQDKARRETMGERLTILPYNIGGDFFKLMYSADLLLVKFGFLQILEGLALGKPLIVLGAGGFTLQAPDKLDKAYQDVLRFDLEITDATYEYIKRFIEDERFRNEVKGKIAKLHNGALYGAKKAAEAIGELNKRKVRIKKKYPKKLAVLVNNEILEKEAWLKQQTDIYPFCIVTGVQTENFSKKRIPDTILNAKILELNLDWNKEVLPHSFKQVSVFSERRLDGFTDIFPWYIDWVEQLERLLEQADEIYLSRVGESVLKNMLKTPEVRKKIKILL